LDFFFFSGKDIFRNKLRQTGEECRKAMLSHQRFNVDVETMF